ncbi:hypothetical protein ALC57_17571, partial [Trachymyrmex cornetzi]
IYKIITFKSTFTYSKESVRFVIGLVEERLSSGAGHEKDISPTLQVLIALRFYAKERRMTGILLGDAGYPCRPYFLIPFLNPQTAIENRYNWAHIRTRICIERCFGEWKGMFKALQNNMQINLEIAKIAIIAMAVLFNIRKQFDNFEYG